MINANYHGGKCDMDQKCSNWIDRKCVAKECKEGLMNIPTNKGVSND